jgi:hypothetical protein
LIDRYQPFIPFEVITSGTVFNPSISVILGGNYYQYQNDTDDWI